jgi:hypothetical protein
LWFPDVVGVAGRRAGKGFLGAIAGAYVTWHLLAMGDPQAALGIAAGKPLVGLVFAQNLKMARTNQWLDLAEIIVRAPCFRPFLTKPRRSRLTLATPADLACPGGLEAGSIVIEAKETTAVAARGVAAYLLFFDEMAYVDPATAATSAEDLYDSAVPATDQCGHHAFIYQASSPATKTGAFYRNYRNALRVDPVTHHALFGSMFVFQLASWDTYVGWEMADERAMIPERIALERACYRDGTVSSTYPKLLKALIVEGSPRLLDRERRDPVKFDVNYRGRWAEVHDAFLNPGRVHAIFGPYLGAPLTERFGRKAKVRYYAHADPATRTDNFAWMIAHDEYPEPGGLRHVVIDRIRVWKPAQFLGGEIDHAQVLAGILEDVDAFEPVQISFDPDHAVMIFQELRRHLSRRHRGAQHAVIEFRHDAARNRRIADGLRQAVNLGQIHCFSHRQLHEELLYLQEVNGRVEHPSSGPVQHDDTAVCLMVLTGTVLGVDTGHSYAEQFTLAGVSATSGRPPFDPRDAAIFNQLGNFRRNDGLGHGQPHERPYRHRQHP